MMCMVYYGKVRIYNWCKTCEQQKNEHQNQAICCKKVFDNDLVAIRKSKVNPM